LYAADVRGTDAGGILAERSDESGVPDYAAHLVGEVGRRRDELDLIFGSRAIRWPVARMSAVDRNILRVAVLELLEGDVPPAAAIDEAVELAKKMSGPEAGGFVNGVLGAVLDDLQASEAGRSPSGGSSD
jgi:N utilization substance protein B